MENNENFVAQTENVEQTTEQTVVEQPKMFTQDEVNDIVGKSKARERAKLDKQYKREYGELIDVLKAGTGKESVEEIADTFRGFYEQKGIQIAKKREYTDGDIEILARADAADIINAGYEEVVEEVDRLSKIGFDNMTARDKALFKALADHRQTAERGRELSSIGVTEDVYNSEEFKGFAGKFSPNTPITEVYEIFRKTQQKPIQTMGSMKNNPVADTGVKEYYSKEEAEKFTIEDFNNNPELYKNVVNSSYKWKG